LFVVCCSLFVVCCLLLSIQGHYNVANDRDITTAAHPCTMPVLITILFPLCDSDFVWRFQLKLSPIFECVQYYYMTWSSPMREGLDNEVDILKTQSMRYCESKVACFWKSCTGNMCLEGPEFRKTYPSLNNIY
jgi:hypothetical protein